MNHMRLFLHLAILICVSTSAFAQQRGGDQSADSLNTLQVFIPNAFSPNADGTNDFWRPVISGPAIESYELTIRDRHGAVVFKSNDPKEVWNGSGARSDFSSSPSVFLYYLVLNVEGDLENKVYQGHITMVR